MTPADGTPFYLFGPLPTGRVAIEASAGTGKTFTLAALATRYLAERDITPSDLLIVTFTRAATAELRWRIRGQMVEAVDALGSEGPGDSPLTRHLASADRELRRRRLELAVADFDAASISTIHGFAAQVRRTLGLSSAIDPDAKLIAEADDLVVAACADALAAASVRSIPPGDFPSLKNLVEATKKKIGSPDLVLVPDGTDGDVDASFVLVHDLVADAVDRVGSRRSTEGTIGFDDVLVELRDELASGSAAAAVDALRSRYKVVLIDEFQDTDRVQWEIFSRLFGHLGSGTSLVLVGDPKQAIYQFRGADISVYLDAVRDRSLDGLYTLTTNWRADGACIEGLRGLLDGATFGDPSIRYVPVDACEANRDRRLEDRLEGGSTPCRSGSTLSGLDLRIAPKAGLPRGGNGKPDSDAVIRMIEDDMATHVRELLDRARIPKSGEEEPRDLRPSDVAVLVTSWSQAESIQRAFSRQGIPAVVAGSGSVLESEAAMQVRYLLDAMERPGDLRRVRTYALSWFEQRPIDDVATADDRSLAVLQDRLTAWSARLADRPVVEVLAQVWRETGVVAKVLALADGDRNVTDLEHIGELLHAGSPQGRSSVAGLIGLLEAPPEGEADADSDNDATARRIESEARTVLITTIWRAKGLEFPVVCVPMLWRGPPSRKALVFNDPHSGARMLDVTYNGEWPTKKALDGRKEIAAREEAAERLRILYVALTRARHHTAVWWAGTADSTNALTRLLFAREVDGTLRPGDLDPDGSKKTKITVPPDPIAALSPLVESSGGALRVSSVSERTQPVTQWSSRAPEAVQPKFAVSTLGRLLDRSVNRWSFTSITRHAADDLTDPFDTSGSDRGAGDESGAEDADAQPMTHDGLDEESVSAGAPGDPDALLGPLMAGTTFGTFVHRIFEKVDFGSPTLGADIERLANDSARWAGIDLAALAPAGLDGTELLVRGLEAAIRTPLGPLFSGGTLASIDASDRIDELAFDLRIGRVDGQPSARDIGRLVVHHLPVGHVLVPWAEALAGGSIEVELGGYLTGSIDLVARTQRSDGPGGFVVADYKTNRLTRWGEPQRPGDYGPGALADAMVEHHYPLQALLYAAALHRYLRWKVPTAGQTTLVTGAAYLFVRGMTGPGVATTAEGDPHGVFTWELPGELVIGLSDLLDGRGPSLAGR